VPPERDITVEDFLKYLGARHHALAHDNKDLARRLLERAVVDGERRPRDTWECWSR
jgi:hypothetical protein